MYLIIEALKESILLTAENNGDAFRDEKNAKRAINEAIAAHLQQFREHLEELRHDLAVELHADWHKEERQEQERQEWANKKQLLKKGEKVEITEAQYDDFLGCVPPLEMGTGYFIMGEPYSHTGQGRPIHMKCWQENGLYFAQHTVI